MLARPACLAVVRLWGLDPLNGLSWTILLVCVEGGGELTKPNIEFLQKGQLLLFHFLFFIFTFCDQMPEYTLTSQYSIHL